MSRTARFVLLIGVVSTASAVASEQVVWQIDNLKRDVLEQRGNLLAFNHLDPRNRLADNSTQLLPAFQSLFQGLQSQNHL